MSAKSHTRPLIVATLVLTSGVAASLAGNLQAINLDSARPGIGQYISAIIWPLFLFGAIEVMLHTPWVKSWRDGLTKWAGLTSVAGVSLWVSYDHLVHVLTAYGYDTVSAHIGPLAIDLTMAMATMALNRIGQSRRGETVPERLITVTEVGADALVTQPVDPGWTPEDEAMLRSWEADMAGLDVVVPISPGAPALARSNEVKPESVPYMATEYFRAWDKTPAKDRPTATFRNILVGTEFEVSARTARRWYEATKASL